MNAKCPRHVCGHVDVGTCPHQVLPATLTLSQPGGADYAFPLLVSTPSFESHRRACALRFVMKNRSISSLINNFKIRIKSYLSERKSFYFSSEIWGRFAFTFCGYFHQNLQVLPSESVAGNTLRFRGKFQYIFQTKFFPLEYEGISYNSACSNRIFWDIPEFFL